MTKRGFGEFPRVHVHYEWLREPKEEIRSCKGDGLSEVFSEPPPTYGSSEFREC